MLAISQPFELRDGDKFAFLLLNNVHVNFPSGLPTRLKDGTWVLDRYPASPDLHWETMVGRIRFHEIQEANLILARVTQGETHILTQKDHDAGEELAQLHAFLQLSGVVEHNAANLVIGSVESGNAHIRRLSAIEKFQPTRGYLRIPVTLDRLEHANNLASVVRSLKLSPSNFGRFGRGLSYLLRGLREESGQERLHHFARALEALILPETGSTRNQFVRRCQLFALANPAAVAALTQGYDMRSDAEHIHDWDRSLQNVSPEKAEDVALWRTRQMEALASFAYTRVLSNHEVRQYFKNDATLSDFWNALSDAERIEVWGGRLDLSSISIVRKYDQWGRAISEGAPIV
ncbi:MAG: hypothetical protein WA755_00220 [Candidatus Acidiferrales bacterium]